MFLREEFVLEQCKEEKRSRRNVSVSLAEDVFINCDCGSLN